MTTYILHGGATGKDLPSNDKFFTEFTNFSDKQTVRILLCYWAIEEGTWENIRARDEQKIKKFSQDKNVEITMIANQQQFLAHIEKADVMYFAGGEYAKLYESVVVIKDIAGHLDGKLVIGSSAGAFLICKQSLNSFDDQPVKINPGLGLLPISILCHWDIEDEKKEKIDKLTVHAPHSPILTLNEGELATLSI